MNSNSPISNPNAAFQQAISLYQSGKMIEALESFNSAILLQPAEPVGYFHRGIVLCGLNRYDEALVSFDRALALKSDYAEAYLNRGYALQELKRPDEALASYDRAVALKPGDAVAHRYRAHTLQKLKRHKDAISSYDRAVALKPDYTEAYLNRGLVFADLGLFEEAVSSFDHAVALKPNYAEAHNNRGYALQGLKRLDEALASYDRAIALQPNWAGAYRNRGLVLVDLRRLDEALTSYDRAIALKPDYAEAYLNRAQALIDLRRHDEALASYDRAIALKPDYAEAFWGKSNLKLLMGDYEEGWELHEWRMKGDYYKTFGRNFQQPQWLGEPETRRSEAPETLLIHAEAGLGDVIQYCRYVPLLKECNIRVVLEVPLPLVTLMSTLEGNASVVGTGKPLPDFDRHCPIGSLPRAFRTTLATIPAKIPYLRADPDQEAKWRKRLGDQPLPRIGLVWSGQANRTIDSIPAKNRSIPLRLLEPLLQLPVVFHSLQKDVRPDDAAVLEKLEHLHDHRNGMTDFADTAALIKALDLVISIDTSVAHLAGALGQKVWVLLPFSTDYRWTLTGTSTPWYPTATLFRQSAIGDWESVISEVAAQLRDFTLAR